MSDESHAFNMSYTTAATIRLFPVELLTCIFYFVGPSSRINPYPYLPLCWVCRRWRDIVLNDPRFWSVLNMGKHIDWGLNKEVIHRSNSRALDVIMYSSDMDKILWSYNLDVVLRLDKCAWHNHQIRARVGSLFLPKDDSAIIRLLLKGLPNLAFPQLERLTGSLILGTEDGDRLVALIAASRLRYAELPWVTLLSLRRQKLLHHLSRVEWLETRPSLTGQPAISVLPEILESLPNLQILILSKNFERNFNFNGDICQASRPLIKLPRLRLLSLDLFSGKSWTFHAPNLDYLCVLSLGGESFLEWNLLENINFSEINNILIGIHANIAENYLSNGSRTHPTGSVACISGSDRLQLDCLSFKKFHCSGLDSRAAVNDYLDLPPKNTFHLSMPWAEFQAFDVVLKRATNLVELTVNYGATKTDSDFSLFLVRILDSVSTRITRLNIAQGRSFVETCTLLADDGRRAPRLERLMYHNAFTIRITTFLPGRMEKLQNARLCAGSSPLKILELRNFADIPSWGVQKIEDLGMQLIQMV